MARFGFTDLHDEAEEPVVGVGVAMDGRIRVVVGADGRVCELTIAPQLLGRFSHDSAGLAEGITVAVNVALDDLDRHAAPEPDGFAGELSRIGAEFARAVDGVRAELERAERRIAGS